MTRSTLLFTPVLAVEQLGVALVEVEVR